MEGMLENKPYDTGEEEQSHTMNQLNIFVVQCSFILVSTLAQAELHTEHLNKQMASEIQSKTRTEVEVWAKRAEKQTNKKYKWPERQPEVRKSEVPKAQFLFIRVSCSPKKMSFPLIIILL